ncbi:MAG TPA: hypothetical protein VLU99_08765 [Nitrososphaerales archaeon]|nr:hypothetical protein [Nitrososphaerales archaeon]
MPSSPGASSFKDDRAWSQEILKSTGKTETAEMSAEDGETDDDFEDDFEDSDGDDSDDD